MKKFLTTLALAALANVVALPAASITFPSLTTIYVGSGVVDGIGANVATIFSCSNVSGITATLRVQVLFGGGSVAGAASGPVTHGSTLLVSTRLTAAFIDNLLISGAEGVQGVVNIESTQSAVFCTAAVVDSANAVPIFSMPLHLVRINPHPGTVE